MGGISGDPGCCKLSSNTINYSNYQTYLLILIEEGL